MYRRKSVGSIMESCKTPTWTGYSCEDFPFRTTGSHVITEKRRNKAKYWPDIP